MEEQPGAFPPPSAESWKAFEGYLNGSLLGRVKRVIDEQGPGVARFGFSIEMGHALHVIRVGDEFWQDIKAPHIRTALSVMRLADEIRAHNHVTIVMEKGTPTVRSN